MMAGSSLVSSLLFTISHQNSSGAMLGATGKTCIHFLCRFMTQEVTYITTSILRHSLCRLVFLRIPDRYYRVVCRYQDWTSSEAEKHMIGSC